MFETPALIVILFIYVYGYERRIKIPLVNFACIPATQFSLYYVFHICTVSRVRKGTE